MSNFLSSKHDMHVLERRNEDQLILCTEGLTGCVGNIFLLLGLVCSAVGFYNSAGWFYGPLILFIGLLLRFGPQTTIFDRNRGEMKIRRFHYRHNYPLSQIENVRLVPGRWVRPVHANSVADRPYQSYQIVLSLNNPFEKRIVLIENGDGALQDRYAREIASFLGVPYFDQRNLLGKSFSDPDSVQECSRTATASPEELKRLEKQDQWALKRADRKKQKTDRQKKSDEDRRTL